MARVLIVEDEGLIALQTEADLISVGHEVVGIAATGQSAVEIAEREKPEIILMDIVLQGNMSGIDASRRICELLDCKTIYLTAHADEKTIEEAKSTRHVGFLHKPIEPRQLQMGIEKALQ